MKLCPLIVALALAAGSLAAGPEVAPEAAPAPVPTLETVSLTVARRGTRVRPAEIAMATVPLPELRAWLGRRAGWDPAHVELEADPRGGLPTLRVTDDEGRARSTLARPRDLTRARALIEAAMAREPATPVHDEADLADLPGLGSRASAGTQVRRSEKVQWTFAGPRRSGGPSPECAGMRRNARGVAPKAGGS